MMATGKSEFGGGGGMVQPEQVGHETPQQEVWEVYATNAGDPKALDGSELQQNAPGRVGQPVETYTKDAH
jgi:hypothetical protein